jgi:hypothetical protein
MNPWPMNFPVALALYWSILLKAHDGDVEAAHAVWAGRS